VQGLATRLIALAAAAVLIGGCAATKNTIEENSHLRVAHANGETIVPARANRVVTLVPDALDTAIALGVRPVGASLPAGHRALPGYLGERVAGVKPVGPDAHPHLGRIRALAPDLIIGYKTVQGRIYRRLDHIAPTVTTDSLGHADWELNARLYSEALGRQASGENLLRDYDHRVARLKRAAGPRRGEVEVSLVRVVRGGVRVYNTGSFAGSILNDAGIGRALIQDAARAYFVVPPGKMSDLDGDLIILSRAPGSSATYRRLVSDPRWRALRGVRAGHVHQVDDSAWYVGDGMLAARLVMNDLARLLAGQRRAGG
jgi:iron complex transport system substrate-binding protein